MDDDDDDDDDLHCPLEPYVRLQLPSIVRYLHIRYCRVKVAEIKIPLSSFDVNCVFPSLPFPAYRAQDGETQK